MTDSTLLPCHFCGGKADGGGGAFLSMRYDNELLAPWRAHYMEELISILRDIVAGRKNQMGDYWHTPTYVAKAADQLENLQRVAEAAQVYVENEADQKFFARYCAAHGKGGA